jgi:glycosyltransferase involved in cell wall biosynthesis
MACGTPVVASDVGGLQFTVVNGETGLLVPPQNVPAFNHAIDQILSDPQWQQELGKAAKKRVIDKFSWHGVASQLDKLYTQLLQQSVREPALVGK